MAVQEGRNASVTVLHTTRGEQTIAELGTWSLGGQSRDMIEYTAFGDTVKKFKPGMLDPGEVSFEGFYDPTDDYGQVAMISALSSGIAIGNSTSATLRKLRLWGSGSTAVGSTSVYGFWSVIGSSGELYITNMELGQDKNGLGTVSFTLKASLGGWAWSTST